MPEPDATLNIAAPTDLLLAISQAIILVDTQPAGRDIALCKTKLDEAMFWGARAVGLIEQKMVGERKPEDRDDAPTAERAAGPVATVPG